MLDPVLTLVLALVPPTDLDARADAARTLDEGLNAPACGSEAVGELARTARRASERLGSDALAQRIRADVRDALWREIVDREHAAARLRADLERARGDLVFRPRLEADLPAGFPAPTPVGAIELKGYPGYRLARTEARGSAAFWRLFAHIESNEIAMTAPVEMTYGQGAEELQETAMAFLYGDPDIGAVGREGRVDVLDVPPALAVGIGCRGRATDAAVAEARARLVEWLATRTDLEVTGPLRRLGYNSPMVPTEQRYYEVQLPVRRIARRL